MTVQCDYSTNNQPAESVRGALLCRCPEEQGCAESADECRGLSTAHISPPSYQRVSPYAKVQGAYFEYYPEGELIRVKHSSVKFNGVRKGGATRSKITLFSRQSKKRMMNQIGMQKKAEVPLIFTLTYPEEFLPNSRKWKRDLDVFFKRMKRKFPGSSGRWKLEPQRRGAPHFHVLIWGISKYDLLCWLSLAWYEVVGSGDEKHLRAGTNVQDIRSWKGVMSYASKYMGKIMDKEELQSMGWNQPGRFWGTYNKAFLPVGVATYVNDLKDDDVYNLIRMMRKYAKIKARQYRTLTIMATYPQEWARCAEYFKNTT